MVDGTGAPAKANRMSLHHLLLASADRDPDAPAYLRGEEIVSYASLVGRSRRIAGFLRGEGIRKGDRVALVLESTSEYLSAYYGVLMAGATVVPLNPDTRTRSLTQALRHCEASACIIAGSALPYLLEAEAALPSLRLVLTAGTPRGKAGTTPTHDLARIEREHREASEEVADPDSLASINYTSGTTGAPKGVMLSHRNLVTNVRSIVEYLGLTPADRIAMVLPYYYVYGNSVLHTHLAAGGSIVQAGSMTFPVRVLEEIQARRCTGLSGVPSTFASLLRVSKLDEYDLSSLRYVTQAGAAMTGALTAALRSALPGARIFVMYGQTEASARLSYLPPEDLDRKPGSVGIGIPGVTLRVVDPEGKEVPRGTVGEVVAEGENIMVGYLDDPEATARALKDGALHTGDMGRLDEDGYLFIVGRQSEMIKSGGHRIGPHEIEDVIAAIDGVAECAVVGVADEMLGQAIVAAVVLHKGVDLDATAIKRSCLIDLPRYKVPGEVKFVSSLPRSDRGKLLRSALRESLEAERGS